MTAKRTVLDEVILEQTDKARSTSKTLREHEACGYCKLLAFHLGPAVDVLHQRRQRAFFKRPLEILVSVAATKCS